MNVISEIYGADADGRRGVLMYTAELEKDDKETVQELIKEQFDIDEESYVIYMTDDNGNEFEFDVDIDDWFDEKEKQELIDKYNSEMED